MGMELSAFFHVILSFYTLVIFQASEDGCRLSVDIFAIEVCEELRDGLKGLVGKKSFLTGRDGQLDSGQMYFCNIVISIISIFIYIIYYN